MNHKQDNDMLHEKKTSVTEEDESLGQIAFTHLGDEMRHIVASAEPKNGGYWNLYVEGRRVGMLARDLKTRTGD